MRIFWVALASAVAGGLMFSMLADNLSPVVRLVIVATTFLAWCGGAVTAVLAYSLDSMPSMRMRTSFPSRDRNAS